MKKVRNILNTENNSSCVGAVVGKDTLIVWDLQVILRNRDCDLKAIETLEGLYAGEYFGLTFTLIMVTSHVEGSWGGGSRGTQARDQGRGLETQKQCLCFWLGQVCLNVLMCGGFYFIFQLQFAFGVMLY